MPSPATMPNADAALPLAIGGPSPSVLARIFEASAAIAESALTKCSSRRSRGSGVGAGGRCEGGASVRATCGEGAVDPRAASARGGGVASGGSAALARAAFSSAAISIDAAAPSCGAARGRPPSSLLAQAKPEAWRIAAAPTQRHSPPAGAWIARPRTGRLERK